MTQMTATMLTGAGMAVVLLIVLWYVLLIVPTKWLKVERVTHPALERSLRSKGKVPSKHKEVFRDREQIRQKESTAPTISSSSASSGVIGKTVLQISDIHVEKCRVQPNRLKQILQTERMDYIFITGDFLDNIRYLPRLERYLGVIYQSGIPTYAVLGNHDYRARRRRRLEEALQRFGIRLLKNECVQFQDFQLVGIDDYYTGHHDIEKAFRDVLPWKPVVVITHDPNIVPYINKPFDYLMAGHLHGKQVNIPFFFRLRPMGPLPARGIYQGIHEVGGKTVYISKGLGQVGFNIRFAVRSEVTIHRL